MTGLMPFILAMIATPPDRLRNADPVKLAAKYQIPAPTAAFYLDCWCSR